MAARREPPAKEAAPAPAPAAPVKKGVSLWLVLVIVLVAAGGAGAAAWFMAGGSGHAEGATTEEGEADAAPATPQPAQYIALEPAFVVNLADTDGPRYLQVEVQLMTRDPLAATAIETHQPALRNALLMLFTQQRAADLGDRAGKEALQTRALEEVQRILQAETGKPGAQALLFTSFVTQ